MADWEEGHPVYCQRPCWFESDIHWKVHTKFKVQRYFKGKNILFQGNENELLRVWDHLVLVCSPGLLVDYILILNLSKVLSVANSWCHVIQRSWASFIRLRETYFQLTDVITLSVDKGIISIHWRFEKSSSLSMVIIISIRTMCAPSLKSWHSSEFESFSSIECRSLAIDFKARILESTELNIRV